MKPQEYRVCHGRLIRWQCWNVKHEHRTYEMAAKCIAEHEVDQVNARIAFGYVGSRESDRSDVRPALRLSLALPKNFARDEAIAYARECGLSMAEIAARFGMNSQAVGWALQTRKQALRHEAKMLAPFASTLIALSKGEHS